MADPCLKVKVLFFYGDRRVYERVMSHVPRVGDEIRINDDTYYKVNRIVWVYDEADSPYERCIIELVEA